MRTDILRRQQDAMAEHGLDAMISCSPENFAYAAGFIVPSHPVLRHRHAMAIVPAVGAPALFGVDMEASTIAARVPDVATTIWKEFSDDPMIVLADQLAGLGLGSARLGIETDYLPAADMEKLAAALPKARFAACGHILSRLRQIKTTEEIELLGRLSRIADRAIAGAIEAVGPGSSELDIAAHVTRSVYAQGAEQFKLLIVATGERSQLPNTGPTDRAIEPGDVCRVEIFPVLAGYHAGVCRTAVVERAPPRAEEIWQVLVDAKYQLMEMVKPGASCLEIYSAFIARFEEKGLPPISFVGHGIGLHLHEDPYLGSTPMIGRPGDDARLEEGMVLGFEPLCYRTGYGFGMQNKDMLLVTASGSELLSDHTDTDRLLVTGG